MKQHGWWVALAVFAAVFVLWAMFGGSDDVSADDLGPCPSPDPCLTERGTVVWPFFRDGPAEITVAEYLDFMRSQGN